MNDSFRHMTAVYLRRGEQLLLLYRMGSRVVGNSWTGTAGGHFESHEFRSPRACLLRELREETGLTEDDLENLALRYVTLRLKNGEVRQNYYFFADLKDSACDLSSNEGRLQWFSSDELPALEMPVTAKNMIEHYISVGRYNDRLYCGVTTPEGTAFTPMEEF